MTVMEHSNWGMGCTGFLVNDRVPHVPSKGRMLPRF